MAEWSSKWKNGRAYGRMVEQMEKMVEHMEDFFLLTGVGKHNRGYKF